MLFEDIILDICLEMLIFKLYYDNAIHRTATYAQFSYKRSYG